MSAPQPQSKVPQGPSASCATFAYLLGNRLAQIAPSPITKGPRTSLAGCCGAGNAAGGGGCLLRSMARSNAAAKVEMTNCHCC